MRNTNYLLVLLSCLSSFQLSAQDLLTVKEAAEVVLTNNYGIIVSKNNVSIAENNASAFNNGYLPTVTGDAGAIYNLNDVEAVRQDGSVTSLTGARSRSYNASVNVNYTLFDGMGRKYNFEKLQQSHQLTELEARETAELTLLELFGAYYHIARLTENLKSLEQSMSISQSRLIRARYQADYGQGSKLDVLNAEVDINNDSVNYFNLVQELANAKHNLNLLLARDIRTSFDIDTNLFFMEPIAEEVLFNSMKENNVNMMQMQKEIDISTYDFKVKRSDYLPVIGVSGSYGWNKNFNNQASFLVSSTSTGFSGGVNLNWNIFDGGRTKTNVQNARVVMDNQTVLRERLEKELERDFVNAWENYQNKLFILKTQERNLKTTKTNFLRTEELNKLGKITSIEFRQAQLNLLNAELQKTFAKYDAKVAEMKVLQVSGQLLDSDF